jgi:hypothetical protein
VTVLSKTRGVPETNEETGWSFGVRRFIAALKQALANQSGDKSPHSKVLSFFRIFRVFRGDLLLRIYSIRVV